MYTLRSMILVILLQFQHCNTWPYSNYTQQWQHHWEKNSFIVSESSRTAWCTSSKGMGTARNSN